MTRKIAIVLFFTAVLYSTTAHAFAIIKTDSLVNFLQINDQYLRERTLIAYFKNYFYALSLNDLTDGERRTTRLMLQYKLKNEKVFEYFIEGINQKRLLHLPEAESALIKAVNQASKAADDYLLYITLSYLAFVQTDNGDAIGAIFSYRMAKKEAVKLGNIDFQIAIDVNISDVYYKYNFYTQSLSYLKEAQELIDKNHLNDPFLINLIFANKSENYFRMNAIDSLKVYSEKLKNSKSKTYLLNSYICRDDYYLCMLQHNYKEAIRLIYKLQKDNAYEFDDLLDRKNLVDAYYKSGNTDSAIYVINLLLAKLPQNNHPEIKSYLYNVLGQIAESKNDHKLAVQNFKMALQQSAISTNRLTQVGDILSLMKIDEIESSYTQKAETYKKELIGLILTVVVALLTIVIIAMFYRSVTQKRHYEKLLYDAQRKELTFINSHEVRKHLANILGIMDLIKHSKNKEKEYLELEDFLLYSSEQLDKAIKDISKKLDE